MSGENKEGWGRFFILGFPSGSSFLFLLNANFRDLILFSGPYSLLPILSRACFIFHFSGSKTQSLLSYSKITCMLLSRWYIRRRWVGCWLDFSYIFVVLFRWIHSILLEISFIPVFCFIHAVRITTSFNI